MAKPQPIIIGQGSNGCIYRPGIQCDGHPFNSSEIITKIQKTAPSSTHETAIGKKIMEIGKYQDHFAPITGSCKVSLASIDSYQIKKCNFLSNAYQKNTALTYESNAMKYVGKQNIIEYLLFVHTTKPNQLLQQIISKHLYLLDGFIKLSNKGIIHFDVKDNNIMCTDNTYTPIIIDFGLSIDISEIKPDNYKKIFFSYAPDYLPWCMDICMISYIVNKIDLSPNSQANTVNAETITTVINDFLKKNNVISEAEKTQFQQNYQVYFEQFNGKPWTEVIDNLLQYKLTWDNYALALIYLQFMDVFKMNNITETFPKWKEYKTLLQTIILSTPDQRPTIIDTKTKITAIFNNVNRDDMKNQISAIIHGDPNIAIKGSVPEMVRPAQI